MIKLLDRVKSLSAADTKTLSQKALKTAEEVGELAKVVLPYDNAFATTHRFIESGQILEEVADVMLTVLSIAYDLGYDHSDIFDMMDHKADKWERLQTKSSVNYPLPYEIHVTVTNVRYIADFKQACTKIGVKPIVLQLQNQSGVQVMGDVMTSSKHYGNNRSAYEAACQIKDELDLMGFDVVRVKIESVPWHPAAPANNTEQMPPGCYFESHLPINIAADDVPTLREVCEKFDLHVSRNVFKQNEDGTVVVMTTFRKYDLGYVDFQANVDAIIYYLSGNGYNIGKSVVEFSVYDTKNSHDAAWLTSN